MFLCLNQRVVIPHQFIVIPCCISVICSSDSLQVTEPFLSFEDGENSADSSESLCLFLGKE